HVIFANSSTYHTNRFSMHQEARAGQRNVQEGPVSAAPIYAGFSGMSRDAALRVQPQALGAVKWIKCATRSDAVSRAPELSKPVAGTQDESCTRRSITVPSALCRK